MVVTAFEGSISTHQCNNSMEYGIALREFEYLPKKIFDMRC